MTGKIRSTYINEKGQRRMTPLNQVWADMKRRCLNANCTNYSDYGLRGITVCDEWTNDFQSLARWALSKGYHKGLQIDRINNEGGYSPANCRFVKRRENNSNKRNNNEIVGISWDKRSNKWKAQVRYQGKKYYLGIYSDKEIAAFAYKLALTSIKEIGHE